MARPEFVSLVNPLATHMLGESASVEIQASKSNREGRAAVHNRLTAISPRQDVVYLMFQ